MTPSSFADYVADLKLLLEQLHDETDRYQSIDLHVELVMGTSLLIFEITKRKGLVDKIAYARTSKGNSQVSTSIAYDRVKAFLTMQDHIALTGSPKVELHPDYPHAVIQVDYRARGAAFKSSTKMILVGVNGLEDAGHYLDLVGEPAALVSSRPQASIELWEWK